MNEKSVIERIANKNGFKLSEIKDYFIDFCKDSNCLYFNSGHFWVLTTKSDSYYDWSNDYFEIVKGK